MIPADPPLRQNRDFLTVLGGQGVSALGDAITFTALPLLVLGLTGSGLLMGIVGVLSTLPDLLVGLVAGVYADRWDRRKMMLYADLGRAAFTALIPISVWLNGPTIAVILLITLPLNMLRVLWLAAFTAAIPNLVGRSQLLRGRGMLEVVWNTGFIAGPAITGVLVAWIGPGPTIAIDAASFALAALSLVFVRRPMAVGVAPVGPSMASQIREGIAFVAGHRVLRMTVALWTLLSVITAGFATAGIYLVSIDRHQGPEVVGLVLSAYSVGSLAGATIATQRAPRRLGPVLLGGTLLLGGLLTLLPIAPEALLMVLVGVSGAVMSVVMIAYSTLRTFVAPDAMQGRVGATTRTLSIGLMPIGSLAAGASLDLFGGAATIAAMGALLLATGAGFALSRGLREARLEMP